MRTILELNEKWWYRLLKVIYVIIFILITILVITAVFVGQKPNKVLDPDTSTVVCLDGNRKTYSYSELGIFNDSKVLSTEQVFLYCDLSAEYADEVNNRLNNIESGSTLSERMDATVQKGRIEDEVKAKVSYNYKTKYLGSWWSTVTYSVAAFLLTILVLDLVRRTFYYVVLGSFRPSKK